MGGSQEDIYKNFDELIKNQVIYDEMQAYFPISEFDTYEEAIGFYKAYFHNISKNGCGYVAWVNVIFHAFEGQEKAFYNTFGFPMYTVNNKGFIDFNYEPLIIKYYNYSVLTYEGLLYRARTGLAKETYQNAYELLKNKKIKLPDNYRELSYEEQLKWFELAHSITDVAADYYNRYQQTGIYDDYYTNFGLDPSIAIGSMTSFLAQYGLSVRAEYNSYASTFSVRVGDMFSSKGYDLRENGRVENFNENVPYHTLVVTEVTEDNILIASTNGLKLELAYAGGSGDGQIVRPICIEGPQLIKSK